ncbi:MULTISPECIES: hypothetical protein, partial [unclassified Acinetobacter]|uniref:hypothetical protein n=1 Tax=unclassified Acinetobacter TaxID=196816 RepID=UPI002576B2C3
GVTHVRVSHRQLLNLKSPLKARGLFLWLIHKLAIYLVNSIFDKRKLSSSAILNAVIKKNE